MTLKQRKFVKGYIKNGGNATQAALSVYDTEDYQTAGMIASENLKKPKLKQAIEEALIKLKITPEYMLNSFNSLYENNKDSNPNAAVRRHGESNYNRQSLPLQKSLSMSDGNVKSISWQE